QRDPTVFGAFPFGNILSVSQYPSPHPCCLESGAWPKIPGKILNPSGLHVNYGASSTCLALFFLVFFFRSVSLHPPAQAHHGVSARVDFRPSRNGTLSGGRSAPAFGRIYGLMDTCAGPDASSSCAQGHGNR